MKQPEHFNPKAPPNPTPHSSAKTPNLTQIHKQTHLAPKKPFQIQFLHPKYWGIWLGMMILLPLIYLPLRWQFWLGKKLGIVLYHLAKKRRQITLTNLALAFADHPPQTHTQMAKQTFINQGIGIFETLSAWLRPNLFNKTATIKGLQHLITAQKQQKAILLLGGHYTLLDLGGLLCTQFFAADCVYRPQNNPLFEWFIYNRRRHIFGNQIDHKDMRTLVKSIKNQEVIWYTPDQDFGLSQGVMAKFFNTPAATITAPRRLAKLGDKNNPPAVMAIHFYRTTPNHLPKGKKPHYQITITPALNDYPSDHEIKDAQRINDLLESLIRLDPTQYMWFHKRYKTQANGTNFYP